MGLEVFENYVSDGQMEMPGIRAPMRIGLIDVDGHNFPNLPLMKLSAWHKQQGDNVEWYSQMFSGHMDRVYMSKVFFLHSRLSGYHRRGRDHKRRHRVLLSRRWPGVTGRDRTYLSGLQPLP